MSSQENDQRIPIFLITGFLGAGKTTLVNRLLAGAMGDGAGLLVNDFGDVVVDGSLVHRRADSPGNVADGEKVAGLDVFEVAGGSIFCSCKTDNFALGLRMFARLRPQRLFVEASGMSDPSGLDKLLADYRMAADFVLARVICLADAVRTPVMLENLPALSRQIEAADLVLVNKIDLVDEKKLPVFEEQIKGLNPEARIVRCVKADVDEELLAGSSSAHRRGDIESCNSPNNRPGTLQLECDNLPKDVVNAFLHDQVASTWRIKGWIEADDRWWYVSDNAGILEWTEDTLPEAMLPGLTVITPPGGEQTVAEAWRLLLAQ